MNLTEEKQQLEARLAEINKQLEQLPKEGEWRYFENTEMGFKWIAKLTGEIINDGDSACYTELYGIDRAAFNGRCDFGFDSISSRPATISEIEYFMGLHAERLGIKEGVKLNRSALEDDYNTTEIADDNSIVWDGDCFYIGSYMIRDSNGNWATVVKEEVKIKSEPTTYEWQPVLKPKKLVKKSVNLQRKIDKLEGQLQVQKVENKRLLDLINEHANQTRELLESYNQSKK